MAKGDELYSILDEAVLEVSLRAPDKRVRAKRSKPEQPFQFSFESAAGAPQRCAETPELAQALAPVHQVRVREVLDADQAQHFLEGHKKGWTELEVHDVADQGDPFRLRLLADVARPRQAYAQLPNAQEVLLVDGELLSLLDLSCHRP